MKHEKRFELQEITAIKTPNKSHLSWKKYFHRNPLYFKSCADFEAYNEKNKSKIGKKTTDNYMQKPVCYG